MPVLLFCIAFGLSMDYEVFLVARIREYWLRLRAGEPQFTGLQALEAGPRRQRRGVALGLARTGRVITAAALVMSISFAALIAAQVSFMRMFGVGLTLAVLVDATLVRMVLVPAFMHVLGRLELVGAGAAGRGCTSGSASASPDPTTTPTADRRSGPTAWHRVTDTR